jgi:hypothetical protein
MLLKLARLKKRRSNVMNKDNRCVLVCGINCSVLFGGSPINKRGHCTIFTLKLSYSKVMDRRSF